MDGLPNFSYDKLEISGTNDVNSLFKTFFQKINLKKYLDWIDSVLAKGFHKKNAESSVKFKISGNELYKQKRFEESIKLYTESLGYAEFNSLEYGIALANRSAAFYMLEDYLNCLTDISLCLKSNYLEAKKINLLQRQASCFYNLKKFIEYEEVLKLVKQLFPANQDELGVKEKKVNNKKEYYKIKFTIPFLKNDHFMSASSKIKLLFTQEKGRYVVAKEPIFVGDILFVEKAFATGPVLDENSKPIKSKCSFCLADIAAAIPCKECTYFFYCNEECRNFSWKESHQFECFGVNLFYHLGIALPAFRCLMKGIDNNFESNLEPNSNVEIFGTPDDNYKYFNSLLHNIEKMENVTPLLQTSALIVLYLKEKTSFFDWILLQPKIDEKNVNNLVNKIGGLLTKHTAQLMCNSSIILHWDTFHSLNENSLLQENIKDSSEIFDFYHSKPVASGIYPSISMMNHSCKPNISLYFLQDIAIAKAATNINIGEEIFNCYGVDYKSLNKQERQDVLNSCYYFTCSCEICLFKDKEYDNVFNYNICKNCKEKLILVGSKLKCGTCKISFQKSRIRELENNIHTLLQSESTIEGLQAITDKASQFFGQNHELLYNCYEKMFDGCLKQGDTEKSSVYKRKCLQILLKSHGEYSRKFLLIQNALDNLNSGENYLHLYYPIKEISILRYL